MSVDVDKEIAGIKAKLEGLPGAENKLTMIVFSGDLDKQLAAMIIATGAAAMGMKVVLFFTFWAHGRPPRPCQAGDGKEPHFKDVWHDAPQGEKQAETLPDAYGRHGRGNV